MTARLLHLTLHGYWHPGSGRGEGSLSDASALRDSAGLPYLTGRAVKGLCREAARLGAEVGLLTPANVLDLFGSALPAVSPDRRVAPLEDARHATEPGLLRFNDARLGRTPAAQEAWRAWAGAHPDQRACLFVPFSSTAIDPRGVASDATLRTLELVVPVELHAGVSGPDDVPWGPLGEAIALFLRAVGSHRNRGLGRATAALEVT